MSEFNADRILLALQYRGWRKKDLAVRMGVHDSTVTKWTNGNVPLTESHIERIASVTGFPIAFFLTETHPIPGTALTFQRCGRTRKSDFNRVTAEFNILTDAMKRLLDMTKLKDRSSWIDSVAPRDLPLDGIERLATETRDLLGVPVDGPLMNVTRSLEKCGIAIAPLNAPQHIQEAGTGDGVTAPGASYDTPVIGYFKNDYPGDRQRFTIAHEVGHLVLHRYRIPQSHKELEREANEFAGALLVPKPSAMAMLSPSMDLKDYLNVKLHWGVSVSSLIMRAAGLGIIDNDRKRSLLMQVSVRGWRMHEPVKVEVERPLLVKQMMGSAFGEVVSPTESTVSRTAVENLLGVPFEIANTWSDGLTERDDFRIPDDW